MKVSVSLLAVLVLQTGVALSHSLDMYKACMFECFNCVTTWGKEVFNGQRCADDCAYTEGTSLDLSCEPYFVTLDGGAQGLVSKGNKRVGNAAMAVETKEANQRTAPKDAAHDRNGWPFAYRLSFPPVSMLSRLCRHLCRTCEAQFTSDMDVHACMYHCATTKGQTVQC